MPGKFIDRWLIWLIRAGCLGLQPIRRFFSETFVCAYLDEKRPKGENNLKPVKSLCVIEIATAPNSDYVLWALIWRQDSECKLLCSLRWVGKCSSVVSIESVSRNGKLRPRLRSSKCAYDITRILSVQRQAIQSLTVPLPVSYVINLRRNSQQKKISIFCDLC